jgi:YHS domain-containing protein
VRAQQLLRTVIGLAVALGLLLECGSVPRVALAQRPGMGPSKHPKRAPNEPANRRRGGERYATGGPSIFEQPPHGGQVTSKIPFTFEVVYQPRALRLYVYDALQQPLALRQVRGDVVMQPHYSNEIFRYPLAFAAPPANSPEQEHLAAAVDVSRVPDGQMTVTFQLENLPDPQQPQANFHQTFALTRPPPEVTLAPISGADLAGIERQRVCPVTGAKLGNTGVPVKILVDGQPLYLCSQDCVRKVRESPLLYAPRTPPPRRLPSDPVAAGPVIVADATAADAAEIRRQRECPVSHEPLGQRGAPVKITVPGQVLFVCCRACASQVQQQPERYLAQVPPARTTR